tara:strand:+ start:54 stop:410 length:357 start_codon:yes stop_codon:yes gene_type:complete
MDYISLPENDIELKEVYLNEEEFVTVMKQREKDIEKISSDIFKVHEIFSDLGKIVNEQQEDIDNIESQTEQSLLETNKGLQQLNKASKNQIKFNKCYLYVFVIFFIFIILLFLFLSIH